MRVTGTTAGSRVATIFLCALMLGTGPAATAEPTARPSPAEPAPSSVPMPNAGRPLTHDELLAWRGELGLDPDVYLTLVADTTIERTPPPRGVPVGFRAEPGVGTLPRHGAYPGDPVVEASKAVRSHYPVGEDPIAGLLALTVGTDDMHLRGAVATPAGSYLTPIEQAAMAAEAGLPEGALIAVHGWLSQLRPSEPCPELPPELRGGRLGGGSPFADCPRGWLTPDEVGETLPGDPMTPAQLGIRVQDGAVEHLWQRFERGSVTEATYLLRRIANPIAGAEPAMGWEAIAILDPVAIPAAPVPAADVVRPTGLDWIPVLERQPPSDTARSGWTGGSMLTTTWAGGFASVHQGRDRVLSSWVSGDGREWRSAALPRGIRHVEALLRLGDGLAIIADSDHTGEWQVRDWRFEVWRSHDGLDWRQVSRQRIRTPARFADREDDYYRIVAGFWSVAERIVAHETYTTLRCCGNSTGTAFVSAAESEPVTFALSSADGRTWKRARVHGLHAADGWGYGSHVQEEDGGLVAVAVDGGGEIDRSADGVRWHTIGRAPSYLQSFVPTVLEGTASGFVLGGLVAEPRGPDESWGESTVLWFSSDADRWIETARPDEGGPGGPVAVAAVGDTVVVAGSDPGVPDLQADADPPWILVSHDGGRTWDGSSSWTAEEEWCLRDLTSRRGTILLDVGCPGVEAASKYLVSVASPPRPEPTTQPRPGVATPLEVLSCDDELAMVSLRDEWANGTGFDHAHQALAAALGSAMVPRAGYEAIERNDSAVLYGYRVRDEVKSAVRVTARDGAGGDWIPERLATCGLYELGDARMGAGIWLWTDRAGHSIAETRGGGECSPGLRFLHLADERDRGRHTKVFVRDPEGDLRDQWRSTYARGVVLPAEATFTGFRRDGAGLWLAADGDALYLKRGVEVERWPRVRSGASCE